MTTWTSQTADHDVDPHRHAVNRPQLLSDREDVQQGLGRMFSHAVSSVDHWLTTMTRSALGGGEEEERRRRGGTLASKLRQLCFIVVAEDSPPRLQAAGVAAPERRRSSSWSGRSRPESLPSAWTRWIRRSGPRSRPDAAWRQQRSWRCECWLRRTSTPSLYPGRCISGLSWEYNISTAVNKRFSRGAARPSGFPGFALSGPSDVECGPHWKGVRSETKDEKNKHISDLKTPKYCTCAVIKPSSDQLINSNCCTDPQGSEHDKWTSVIL